MFISSRIWYFRALPGDNVVRVTAREIEPVLLDERSTATIPQVWDYAPGVFKGLGVVVLVTQDGEIVVERSKTIPLARSEEASHQDVVYDEMAWIEFARSVYFHANEPRPTPAQLQSLAAYLSQISGEGVVFPTDLARQDGVDIGQVLRLFKLGSRDRLVFDLRLGDVCYFAADGRVIIGRDRVRAYFEEEAAAAPVD